MTLANADVGLIGLAVMGQNLVLNMADQGYKVAVYNRTYAKTQAFISSEAVSAKEICGYQELADFCAHIVAPRRVFIMVKAGPAVDAVITELLAHLEPGGTIIDAGNSFYADTIARAQRLGAVGLRYLGLGVSGGEEGARHGPSLMPGGDRVAFDDLAQLFSKIAAQDPAPCVAYLGQGGAGHYVKMVHNGIEYGQMELIAEVYGLLKLLGGRDNSDLAALFAHWNQGDMASYLLEITAKIFQHPDDRGAGELLDQILDQANQKGTGSWTSQEAMKLGVPLSLITAAVEQRSLSASTDLRQLTRDKVAQTPLTPPALTAGLDLDICAEHALWAATLVAWVQGFELLAAASKSYDFGLDMAAIARIWRGGCIIRAAALDQIAAAWEAGADTLLAAPYFQRQLAATIPDLRLLATLGIAAGLSLPALTAAISYLDALAADRLPTNLTQAQRDYFGAHTYQRVDIAGTFHSQW